MTAPVRDWEVILGKFFGTWLFFLAMLAPTLIYVLIVLFYGPADVYPILSGYLGLVLLGGLFVAVGVLTSAMTRNQVVAAVLAFLILSAFTFLLLGITYKVTGTWQRVLMSINIYERFGEFSRGLIDLKHVVFFLSASAGVLFVAVKILESRRWR